MYLVPGVMQGVAGTTSGTLWYVNWAERSSVRLVPGHKDKVPGTSSCQHGSIFGIPREAPALSTRPVEINTRALDQYAKSNTKVVAADHRRRDAGRVASGDVM